LQLREIIPDAKWGARVENEWLYKTVICASSYLKMIIFLRKHIEGDMGVRRWEERG
jgi:hypothetical protein